MKLSLPLIAVAAVGLHFAMKARRKTLAQQVAEGTLTANEARMMALSRGPGTSTELQGMDAFFGRGFSSTFRILPGAGVMNSARGASSFASILANALPFNPFLARRGSNRKHYAARTYGIRG